jgi:hypothetical protein
MVNRPFPWQWVKWVGWSNNDGYKAVRNAAKEYANALNMANNNPAKVGAVHVKKLKLQYMINSYLKGTPAGAPPAAGPGAARAPPVPKGPTGTENAIVRVTNKNGVTQNRKMIISKQNSNAFANINNKGYRKLKWQKPFGRAGFYIVNNSVTNTWVKTGSGLLIPKTKSNAANAGGRAANAANAAAAARAKAQRHFKNFMNAATAARGDNVQQIAKNFVNRGNPEVPNYGTMNWNKIRRVTKNTNANVATRGPFWAAVNTEMARRAAAKSAFNAWYAAPASGANPTNKARAYVALIKNANANPTNASRRAAIIRRINNVNNAGNPKNRGNFWTTVNTNFAANTSRATGNKSWSKWLANRWAFE